MATGWCSMATLSFGFSIFNHLPKSCLIYHIRYGLMLIFVVSVTHKIKEAVHVEVLRNEHYGDVHLSALSY